MIVVLPHEQRRAELGGYVQACRLCAGLTLDQLARRVAQDEESVRRHGLVLHLIEQGRHLPTAAYVARIAAVLPINPRIVTSLAAPDPRATKH